MSQRRSAARKTRGFTLVELLVTISIIGILAGLVMGALHAARQTAKEAKTKSLITRLDRIIMRRYQSYQTRRVPISTSGMQPQQAAIARLDALRDLIRMEMPERWNDVTDAPVALSRRPSLAERYVREYNAKQPSGDNSHAECLYMIVMSGSAEDRQEFNEADTGDTDNDKCLEFIDGWGKPIYFLRWAPGFSGASDIQTGDYVNEHDAFDTRNVDADAFKLTPLIYSFGPDGKAGIDAQQNVHFTLPDGPFANLDIGKPDGTGDHHDNIHNHHIEAR